jgi:hypothetical protein
MYRYWLAPMCMCERAWECKKWCERVHECINNMITHTHTYTHIYIRTHIYIHIHTLTHIHTHIYTYIYIHSHIYIHTRPYPLGTVRSPLHRPAPPLAAPRAPGRTRPHTHCTPTGKTRCSGSVSGEVCFVVCCSAW